MTHDQDDDLLVPPDRRPLVYGGAAIVILLVAAFLFWPRGGPEDPVGDSLAGSTLMPPGTTTQASDESVQADDPVVDESVDGAEDLNTASTGATGNGMATMSEKETSTPVGTPTNPRAETKIVEDEAPKTPPVRESTTPTRIRETPTAQPVASGDWVLNVGSFSSRSNADRRVEELTRQGITAHVQLGTAADGSPVYRVRVGYFGSSADAKSYGEWLKTSQDLDSWAGRR